MDLLIIFCLFCLKSNKFLLFDSFRSTLLELKCNRWTVAASYHGFPLRSRSRSLFLRLTLTSFFTRLPCRWTQTKSLRSSAELQSNQNRLHKLWRCMNYNQISCWISKSEMKTVKNDQVKHLHSFSEKCQNRTVSPERLFSHCCLTWHFASLSSPSFSKYWRATAWLLGRSHGDMCINARHVQTEQPELTV